jgi:alpha-tubulin suppressor-like RCC1 family protein
MKPRVAVFLGLAACTGTARPDTSGADPVPERVQFAEVSAGAYYTCGITVDSRIHCWGEDTDGQVSGAPDGEWVSVSAGTMHACALSAAGEFACWGSDSYGQVSEAPTGTPVRAVSAGGAHTCLLDASGVVDCWGYNGGRQTLVPPGEYTAISAGGLISAALTTDGSVAVWGDLTLWDDYTPSAAFVEISAGSFVAGVTDSGDLRCWGNMWVPYCEEAPRADVVRLELGAGFGCGLGAEGAIVCWGPTSDHTFLTAVPEGGGFEQVSVGYAHACALRSGELTCWGSDAQGESTPP